MSSNKTFSSVFILAEKAWETWPMGMTDAHAAAVIPVMSYWVLSLFFEACDALNLVPQYRVWSAAQQEKKNLVSRWAVLKIVLLMQAVQVGFALYMAQFNAQAVYKKDGLGSLEYWRRSLQAVGVTDHSALQALAWSCQILYHSLRQLVAIFAFDTWAYVVHSIEHRNSWVYRNIHYVHHLNYAPFAFAAGYNHPIEGFFHDILGPYLAGQVVGLSDRECTLFYTLLTLKAVDDHSDIQIPWSPIKIWGYYTGNGFAYHNIHHQVWGLKSNFALYFTFWDQVFRTQYEGSRSVVDKQE